MRWALPILIAVVFVAAVVASLLPNPKATAEGCPGFCPNLGLDLVGGLRGEYQVVATDNQVVTPEILTQTRAIIEARVNATGVSEPNVQTQGGDRITVELPGAADAEEIRRLVGTTGRLDFVGVPSQYANAIVEGQELPAGMDRTPIFSGDQISAARPGTNQTGELAVDLELKERGANLFDDYAGTHQGQRFAIVLDDKVISAPTINASQFNGHAQISGSFTPESMNELVTVLKFGSLPLEIREVGFSSLSATLGLGFLAQTVLAGLIGIALRVRVHAHQLPLAGRRGVYRPAVLHAHQLRPVPGHPGDADARGHRGIRALGGHGGGRQHPHLRTHQGRAARGQAPERRHRSGLQPGLDLDLRLQRVDTHDRIHPVVLRQLHRQGLRAGADDRRADLDVHGRDPQPDDAALGGTPEVGPQGLVLRRPRGRVRADRAPPGRDAGCPPVFDVVGRRKWFYAFSLAITIPGLLFILLTLIPAGRMGLQFSIAYRGGTEWTAQFANGAPDPAAVVKVLDANGLPGAEVVTTTSNGTAFTLIRTAALSLSESQGVTNGSSPAPDASSPAATPVPSAAASVAPAASLAPGASAAPGAVVAPGASPGAVAGTTVEVTGKLKEVQPALEAAFGPISQTLELTSVGPVVSAELIQQTFLLILMGAVGIMLWITYRFRDFRMGAVALVSLLHDVIVVVGFFAILGTLIGLQIDALFVTAMLTVIGFSVHDTIVVFDRVRENRVRHSGEPYDAIVNHSILQTAGRSISTSLTVVFTLLALFLFGGAAVHSFVLALLIGIVSGTYSSIFNASPLLVDWHLRDERRRRTELAKQAKPQARLA